jgi:hypothetical protein
MDDEDLLRRAEGALTEIKIAQGLSDRHASVLAALRIRLKGEPGKSLDEMLDAAGDLSPEGGGLDDLLTKEAGPGTSLDELLSKEKPKPKWPGSS